LPEEGRSPGSPRGPTDTQLGIVGGPECAGPEGGAYSGPGEWPMFLVFSRGCTGGGAGGKHRYGFPGEFSREGPPPTSPAGDGRGGGQKRVSGGGGGGGTRRVDFFWFYPRPDSATQGSIPGPGSWRQAGRPGAGCSEVGPWDPLKSGLGRNPGRGARLPGGGRGGGGGTRARRSPHPPAVPTR